MLWVRIQLWLQPIGRIFAAIQRRRMGHNSSTISAPQFVQAVEWASGWIPRATCLVQAITLYRLLRQRGLPGRLCLGVDLGPDDVFYSHAWVEHDGEVILGNEEIPRYRVIHDIHHP